MAGYDDRLFENLPGRRLPGSPYRPPVPPNRGLKELMPVSPGAVLSGLQNIGAEAAGRFVAQEAGQPFPWLAPNVGLPNADLLGRDVTGWLQSPREGAPTYKQAALDAAPFLAAATAARAVPRTAEEIAQGVRASPGQTALDRMVQQPPSAMDIATGAKKALPTVAWDPAQQRWLTDNGKPLTSAPLTIPEGGPGYPNLFDPNDPKLAQRPAGVQQFDLPRAGMKKGPAVSPRVADLIANEDVRKQVMDYVTQGQDIGDRWYNTTPIRDLAVQALGEDAGTAAYNKYMGMVGGTSPQQKFPPNLRTASYYYYRDAAGLPPMEKGDPIPPLYGHYVQKLHQQNVKNFLESGGDPLATYDPENPKPPSFNQDLLGNYAPVAVDMHAFKLPAILSRDPRFLETGVPKGAPGYPDFNPREAVTSGQVSMDEAAKNPTWWADAPNPKNEYPPMEQYWKGIANDLGKDPAQAQAGGWVGGGGVTGLGSPPETAAQAFQNRLFNTAYRTGQTPEQANSNFWRGVHPLLSVGGGGVLAAPMLQQYWNAQQQQGATGQGGAPDQSQFW